jgi:membrane protease YdiL (CAAX protease family)
VKEKTASYLEILAVYLMVTLIVGFSSSLVSLGGNVPVKMTITLLVYAVMAAIPACICFFRKISFSELGFTRKKVGKQIIISLCIFTLTFCASVIIPLLLGADKSNVLLSYKYSSVSILIFYIIYDFLFVGFGEEFIFRGYFLNRIGATANSKLLAIILSSILFGLWHYPHGRDIFQVIGTTLIGMVYGFARYKIKDCSLLSVSIAHGLQDTAISVLSYMLL